MISKQIQNSCYIIKELFCTTFSTSWNYEWCVFIYLCDVMTIDPTGCEEFIDYILVLIYHISENSKLPSHVWFEC